MKRGLVFALLLGWALSADASTFWDGLWQTPDQLGQQLLQEGKPARAANVFRDPRHKAYAELEAGNYTEAARDFAAFGDSDGDYNRGNALARAGHLRQAIQAYDAALARNPNNRDARHNRDLVAQALKRQPPPPQSSQGSGRQENKQQNGQSGQNSTGRQQAQGKQGGQSGSNPAGKSGQQSQGQGGQDVSKAGQERNTPGRDAGQAGRHESAQAQADLAQSGEPRTGQTGTGAAQAAQRPDAAAQASLAEPQQQTAAPVDQPLTERQLAEQDWLRRIPDDPGGLLRREFMIEHLLRQQGKQP